MLSSDFESPFVSNTFVASDFIQSFDIFSELGFEDVGSHLEVLAFLVIFLSVEEPSWDTVSFRVADDVSDTIALGFSQLTGSESGVDSEDLADEEPKSSSNTLDLVKSVWDGSLTVDVGVENTVNMLEGVISVFDDQ